MSSPSRLCPPSDQPSIPVPAKRRPIPRKGHTKSRSGCTSCKRRKVKCDEETPECGPCHRLGLQCFYLNKKTLASSSDSSPSLTLSPPLRTGPAMFDLDDMRFFRHFLFEAYPPLPIDGFDVWQQVSQMSHEYEFLLHAMLGLAASHLNLLSPGSYNKAALKHRVLAIKLLNERISNPRLSMPEFEAAFGASLALTFQSVYMPNGLTDFLTMVRGCFLIATHSVQDFESSKFKTFARDSFVEKVKELIAHEPCDEYLDLSIAEAFCASSRRVGVICRSVAELEYLAHIERIAMLAVSDPAESYLEFTYFYDRLGRISLEEFSNLIDPDNVVSQIVIMHMLVLDFVMSRKSVEKASFVNRGPGYGKSQEMRINMSKLWVEQIMERLPDEYKEYATWPFNFTQNLVISLDDDQVWKPFLLSRGANIVYPESSTSPTAIEWYSTSSEESSPDNLQTLTFRPSPNPGS